MKLLTSLAITVLIAFLFGCEGCAGRSEWKTGMALLEQGRCEQAVGSLKAAVERMAPSRETRSALELAEAERQGEIVSKKRKLVMAVKALNLARVCAAKEDYEAASRYERDAELEQAWCFAVDSLGWYPAYQPAQTLLKRVEDKMVHAEGLVLEGKELGSRNEWEAAVVRIKEALEVNRSFTGGEGALQQAKQGGYDWYYQMAVTALEQDDRSGAMAKLAKAETFLSDSIKREQITKAIEDRNQADHLCTEAENSFVGGNFQLALERYRQAQTLYPERKGLQAAIARSQDALCEQYKNKTQEFYEGRQYVEAMEQIARCRSVRADYAGIDELEKAVREALYEQNMARAEQFIGRELWGNGYLYGVLALGYRADDVARGRVMDCADHIKNEVGFRVGVERAAFGNAMAQQVEEVIVANFNGSWPRGGDVGRRAV